MDMVLHEVSFGNWMLAIAAEEEMNTIISTIAMRAK